MGEAQTPHFYDFGIFEPVTKPQNQYYLSLETPGYSKKSRKIPGIFLENIIFIKSRNLEIQNFDHFRKDGHRKIPQIRLRKS